MPTLVSPAGTVSPARLSPTFARTPVVTASAVSPVCAYTTSLISMATAATTALYDLDSDVTAATYITNWKRVAVGSATVQHQQQEQWTSWNTTWWNRFTTGSSTASVVVAGEAENAVVEQTRARLYAQYERETKVARAKARDLLEQHLTAEQRAQLARDNFFVVRSQQDRLYRIYAAGQAGNIRRIVPAAQHLQDRGQEFVERERYCIHPRQHSVPDADAMLLQKLLLETNEDEFLRVANAS